MNHDEYLKRRDELESIRMEAFSSFDKAVLSLSTGCLAFSMAFLGQIGMPFSKTTLFLIGVAWFAFLLVIICNLASYLFAQKNMEEKVLDLDQKYKKEIEEKEPDTEPEKTHWERKATDICNKSAFGLFVLGVLCMAVYIVLIHVNNYQNMLE